MTLRSTLPSPHATHGDLHVADPLGDPSSPYLLTDEAARFLRFNTPALFVKWAKRNRVPCGRRGRALLFDKRVLVAFLEQRSWTKRHAPQSTKTLGPNPLKEVERSV